MRVLALANTPIDVGSGSGYVVINYAEELRRRGHRVDLLGPRDYEPFFGSVRGIRHRQALGMLWALLRRRAWQRYDVLELYGGEAWLSALLLAGLPRRRFILVAHSNGLETHVAERFAAARRAGDMPHRKRHEIDLSWAFHRGFHAADGVVTVSEFDAAYARARGYGHGRVIAIENPLPEEYLGLPFEAERERRIGFVGAWLPRKGIARIVRELPSVLREFPAWRLSLVGVGGGFRAEDHFPADVLPNVEVVPATDRAGLLKAHYPRFAIALLPSIYESFGLAAAEAMACGAALVASPVGFAHSLRDGQEALLVSEAQGSGLGEAVRRLITDEPLRRAIARAGHSRVQALRWTSAVERLEATYRGWLAGQRRTGSSGQAA